MKNEEILSFVIQGAVAFGTILVAVVAIFNEWFKTRLTRPKLSLELCKNVDFNMWKSQDASIKKCLNYHLKVINHKKKYSGK